MEASEMLCVILLAPYFVPPIQVLSHLSSIDVSDSEAKFIKMVGVSNASSKDDQANGFLVVHQAQDCWL